MHTSKDDYLINTLRFVSTKEEIQIYGAILPDSLTSPEMKETKAYKTYLVSTEEPTGKSKRVKRPAKKTTKAPARGVVIRETHEIPVFKKKEKVDVTRGKGIELLSQVALKEDAQFKEVQRKSKRDFHKTRPSGSGAIKIIPSVTSEGTGVKLGVPDVTEEESSKSEAESWGNDEDDSNNEQDSSGEDSDQKNDMKDELVKPPSNDSDDEDETKITDKAEGDEDKEMDYTTSQVYDDVDMRLNEPVDTDKGFVQEEGTDAVMTNKNEVPVTSSSHSSDLAAKFLNFLDIPHTDAEIVSPMDVHVHHEVPSKQTPTLLTVPVSVIPDSSLVYSTVILQSLPSFTPPLQQSTSTPPSITKVINPPSTLLDFTSVFQFNNKVTTLEKEVPKIKKDPLHTQVIALVDDHLDTRLGATRDEFMNFLSASLTARITEQVKNQLPQILPGEVSNFAPSVIQKMVQESLEDRSRKDKDKDEYPSAGSDRGLKKRKTSKDAKPTKGPKAKELESGSSKDTKSQSKSFGKYVQLEELEFKVIDSDMLQDQEENQGKDDEEPKEKTPQQGQNQSWLMNLASSTGKPPKTFDELMSTPIDFSAFIMNGLKINNLTQETLLGPAFRLLKGTHSNYAELEYDFEECYKALSEKLNWENPEGGDYPFDLTKPLPLVMSRNRQKVPVDYFFNNDLKYLQGGILTRTYTTSLRKTKAVQYDLPSIEDMVPIIWSPVKVAYDKHALWGISHWREQCKTFYGYARGMQSTHDVYSTKRILAVTQVEVMRKHRYGYLKEIVVRRADNDLYRIKEGDFPRLRINDIEDMLLLVVPNRLTNLLGDDVSDFAIALIMFTRSLVIQKRIEDL
ncbi:hypothetical protein Tco_0179103 [Tanacetum coccineum]